MSKRWKKKGTWQSAWSTSSRPMPHTGQSPRVREARGVKQGTESMWEGKMGGGKKGQIGVV
jgi:hypothetical protein